MATTTYGTPYVQSSDLVSAYPGTSSTLATRVDDISLKGNGINAQTASYTLVLTDGGKNVTMTVASANTLTVPTNASVAFPTGVGIGVVNLGAGSCTVTPAGGVTVNGASLVLAQYETGVLLKTGTNTWVFSKGGGLPKASYSATTGSPTVTTVSGKTCVKFTGSGSITISTAGVCDMLIIGGGGGSGNNYGNNGGGAGGYCYLTSAYLAAATFTITVGAGGALGPGYSLSGNPSLVGSYASPGGGGAGGQYGGSGMNGGSGGGGKDAAGAGYPPIGNNGAVSATAAGGGGSGSAASGASGGSGTSNSITGAAVTYAAGGAGNVDAAGAANTGNGASSNGTKYAGGSGIVILLFG